MPESNRLENEHPQTAFLYPLTVAVFLHCVRRTARVASDAAEEPGPPRMRPGDLSAETSFPAGAKRRTEPNHAVGSHTKSGWPRGEGGVEAVRMPTKTRYLVFVAVAATHVVVVAVLAGGTAMVRLSAPGGKPIAVFLVTRTARPRSIARPRLDQGSAPIAPIVEPIPLASPDSLVMRPNGRGIDWSATATQAAAATLTPSKRISFGFPPGGKSAITLGVPSPHTPAHYAGESDRTSMGEHIEWTSDRCYVESDPPVPGEPDFLKHARVSRGGCLPPDGPDPGELFKSLPVYKKLHPP